MTHGELSQRVAWLERKMSELLHTIALGFAMFIGWTTANFTMGEPGWRWDWQIVFGVTTIVVFAVGQRLIFKGAPSDV